MTTRSVRGRVVVVGLALSVWGAVAGCGDVIAPPHASSASASSASVNKKRAQAGTAVSASGREPSAVVEDPSGLRVIDGAQLRAEIAGSGRKATLVNLWASWCGSCKKEIPMLLEVARGLESEGVGLVLVSADEPSSRARAVELLREHGAALPSHALGGGVNAFARAVDPRWRGAIPATFLLDAQGKARYFWNGPVLAHEVAPIVQGLLAGEAIDGMTDYAAPHAP